VLALPVLVLPVFRWEPPVQESPQGQSAAGLLLA